jgi:hypothetical protein
MPRAGLGVAGLLMLGVLGERAYGLTLPYKTAEPVPPRQIAEKLVGFAKVDIDAKGKATINVAVSNARAFDGEKRVGLLVRLLNGEGKPVYVAPLQTSLADPMFKARTQQRLSQSFSLPAAAWGEVAKLDYYFFAFTDDEEFKTVLDSKSK